VHDAHFVEDLRDLAAVVRLVVEHVVESIAQVVAAGITAEVRVGQDLAEARVLGQRR
jgi:pyridoxal biosynthesis lyase PdxS